jgi:CBS domain-containing protein
VFNAIPAAPLDGGRILRAALWKWRGDRVWAAVVAARTGRTFGFLLVFVGLWQYLAGAALDGLWLALIGWFLIRAATAEERHTRLGGTLGGVRVGDIMSPDPVTVPAGLTVEQFLDRHLWNSRHSAFPLVDDGRPVGLVTLNRIRDVAPPQRASTQLGAVACGRDDLVLTAADELVTDLLPRLGRCADGRALVVSDGRLVGIVTPTDISRAVQHRGLRGDGWPVPARSVVAGPDVHRS